MNATHGAGALTLAAASAALGWALHTADVRPLQPAAPMSTPSADGLSGLSPSPLAWPQPAQDQSADATDAATVRLHEDGRASVQARRQPPQWILDELCRQGAALRPGACGGAGASPAGETARSDAHAAAAPLAQALRDGSEAQRYDALVQSRTAGVLVAEDVLMRLMAEGPSERVRLAAFDSYMELKSGDVDHLRGGLQAVLRIPYTPLQARAREQLDGIERLYEQGAALQQGQRQP